MIAFSAIRNNDKVGLLLFSDHVELFIPPKKGRIHTLRLIREILFFEPSGQGTAPAQALHYLNRVLSRKAAVFLLSDFQTNLFDRELGITARRHDLIALPVRDPRESALPDAGIVVFEDAETGEQIEVNTGDASVRAAYGHLVERRREEWARAFRRKRIDSIALTTDEDYLPALREFFRTRERRMR